ncbi:CPBP family intramembrane metalloprotease [Massilia agilis]|uniref:CPBP family intramembrane metalloprotease n=1 Tax=Massilia agilis TaxID=1811226 RepID=A0ABT2D9Q9_9BURK|nr:type II CAAX endopeptidase family protein [Massilia agilis]MCS0807887.1 CPBP family intramembrane metalloprotease [Massilia agilis]
MPSTSHPMSAPSSIRLLAVFAVLFIAYQLPEGLGARILHSMPVAATLMVLFLPVAWLCGRALGWRGLDAWYMQRSAGWATLLAACFALAVLVKLGALAAGSALGVYEVRFAADKDWQAWLLAALAMLPYTFIPSVAEDIVTRGFLMRALPALGQRPVFIAASALVYVLNHIYRLSNGPVEWLMLFCFGLAYAAALYYSRSLWPAIGLHWGWNFAGQFMDQVGSVDGNGNGPFVSMAAHLLMFAAVVLVARMAGQPPVGRQALEG